MGEMPCLSRIFPGYSRSNSREAFCNISVNQASCCQQANGPQGPSRKKKGKEKNLGREKTCSVKRACEGARKRPPPHTERPWTPCVRGSLAPLANKRCRQNPKKGASIAPAWPSLGRGAGEIPFTHRHLLGFSRQSVAAKQKGKKKNKTRETHEDPCRLASQEKASEGPRRLPKTPGAQNGTPEKRQEAGRTAKTGGTDKSGRTQKRKITRKTSACAGVSCYYLSFVS